MVGGVDGVAGIYSLPEKRIVSSLKVGGAVTDAVWIGDKAAVATSTGAVKIFENGTEVASFNSHAGEAASLATHATGDILASVGVDKSYVLYDLTTNSVITQIYSDAGTCLPGRSILFYFLLLLILFAALTSVKFHPDGHLVAAGGADGQIKIFDVKMGTSAANFSAGGPVKALFFSENGTWLASVTENSSTVSIWDLRKSVEIKVLETGNRVDSISWDYTGQFLLTGGPNGVTVQKYSKASKKWSEPLRSAVPAVAVEWRKSAQGIVALNGDGALTVVEAKP